jgi:hypothetical protein
MVLRHLFAELKVECSTFSSVGALVQHVGFQTDVRGGKFTKAIIFSLAFLLDRLNWIIRKRIRRYKEKQCAK